MTGLRRRRRVAPVLAIAGLAALPAVIALSATAGRMVMVPPAAHLVVVGTTGALAAAAAICMSVLAARLHDGRAVLLGLAFSVMATMLLFHALATPGVLIGDNGLVQFAGALNIPAGAGILAASALPVLRRPAQMRVLLRVQGAVVAAMVLLGVTVLLIPALVPVIPHPGSGLSDVIFAISAAGLWLLIWRAARTYLLTRRVSDLLVTVGVVWLVGAQYGLLHYGMMDGAFWAAHVLEVSGIGLVGLPAALDLRHGVASRPLVGDLRAADLVDHEEAFLGARVRALMVRLGTKDPSTEGHTRRVATLAVQLGEQLGVPESRLRLLALGGLLHDMGKLSVPDHILTKPGKLDDDEFAVIRRHPAWGRELLAELGGFPPLVLDLVESHHERLDGGGYPRGALAGTLPLEVRILTVADVYDALTADRVYREAWSPERAFGVLDADTGSAFDPACVAALRALLAMPRGAAAGAPARQGARRATGTVLAPGA